MSTEVKRRITLTHEDGVWVARDEKKNVASQGESRQEALQNLDEAVELHERDSGSVSWDEEKEMLEDLGLDPDDVKKSREENDELPEFMQ
ncbi:MAG: type II toxin-antitoxin system HicB family antitoxin [Halobacteria archaeon]|nr:type II toxin-antitoxin system HicB family antitoxin [Halobacteria archaeon]